MEIKQIKTASILSYVQMALSIVINILFTPVMINTLGKSEYGLYNVVVSTIAMLSLLKMGFNSSYVRFYSTYKKENDQSSISKLNGLFLLLFIIIGVIALACGLFITFNLNLVFEKGLNAAEYTLAKILMLILSINLMVSIPMSVFTQIISAHERFVFMKIMSIVKTIINPLVSIPLLLLGYRSIALVMATVLVTVIIDALDLWFVFCKLKEKFYFASFDKQLIKTLFSYTFFIALHIVVDQINWNADKIILGRYRGTEDVAVYSVGYSLYSYYMSIGLPIASFFVPYVHRCVAEQCHFELSRSLTNVFVKVGKIQFGILGLIASGFAFFGRSFLQFWVGDGFEISYYVALLLILPGTIDLIQNLGIEIQRAQNKHRIRSVLGMIMAFFNIVISIVLCKKYGAVGTAIGTSISFIVMQGIVVNIYYHKKCNLNIFLYWKSIFRLSIGLLIPVLFGLIYTSFVKVSSIIMLIVSVLLYTIVYTISMFNFGGIKDDIKMALSLCMKRNRT